MIFCVRWATGCRIKPSAVGFMAILRTRPGMAVFVLDMIYEDQRLTCRIIEYSQRSDSDIFIRCRYRTSLLRSYNRSVISKRQACTYHT